MIDMRKHNAEVIPSAVLESAKYLTDAGIPMHSLLVAKSSKLIAEVYWEPYHKDRLHRIYSCTKSFVSLAIGSLIGSGKLNIDDKIVKYFPDMLPQSVPEELEAMTIRDMLMMRTCYRRTTYKEGGRANYIPSWQNEWVRSFFNTKPDHDPGMFFMYDTSSPHTLAALVERVSGMDFISYIKSTYLSGLEISPDTYIQKDPMGTSMGGCGLMMRPVDMLQVMDGVMHKTLKGVPSWYIDEATSALSESDITMANEDQKLGYGYQFWRMRNNSYAMLGLGGQFAIAIPDKDIVIVTTADTQAGKTMDASILSAIWHIVDNLKDDEVQRPNTLSIPVSRGRINKEAQTSLNGKTFIFPDDNSIGLEKLSFEFSDDEGHIWIKQKTGDYDFSFGIGKNIENPFPIIKSSPCYASGGFMNDGSFVLFVQFGNEELGSIKMQAATRKDKISVSMHLFGELSIDGFEGIAKGSLE